MEKRSRDICLLYKFELWIVSSHLQVLTFLPRPDRPVDFTCLFTSWGFTELLNSPVFAFSFDTI